MKVIENYKTAIENSEENLFKGVFAPEVRLEIPAGASADHPATTISHILSQVAKTAPGIKCTLRLTPRTIGTCLSLRASSRGKSFRRSIRCTSTKMARSITSLYICVPSRWPRGLPRPSCKDFRPRQRRHRAAKLARRLRRAATLNSTLDVGRSSFAPLSGTTAREVSACHAEAFSVGGLGVYF